MDDPLITDDDLFLMANLRPDETGLPMVIWVSERGNARHDARVKVSQAHGSRIDPNNTASVAIRPVLVHKSAVGRGSAAIAVCQAMRCDTGMPSRVIRLSTEQATRASVFWLGRVRARRPRPMMVLYRNTAVSPSERLP